jgi:hypothetical protein
VCADFSLALPDAQRPSSAAVVSWPREAENIQAA